MIVDEVFLSGIVVKIILVKRIENFILGGDCLIIEKLCFVLIVVMENWEFKY